MVQKIREELIISLTLFSIVIEKVILTDEFICFF